MKKMESLAMNLLNSSRIDINNRLALIHQSKREKSCLLYDPFWYST